MITYISYLGTLYICKKSIIDRHADLNIATSQRDSFEIETVIGRQGNKQVLFFAVAVVFSLVTVIQS